MATHFSAVGQIRQFAGEAAADIRELRQFLKKEKALKLICLSLILVCWGLKIVYVRPPAQHAHAGIATGQQTIQDCGRKKYFI